MYVASGTDLPVATSVTFMTGNGFLSVGVVVGLATLVVVGALVAAAVADCAAVNIAAMTSTAAPARRHAGCRFRSIGLFIRFLAVEVRVVSRCV